MRHCFNDETESKIKILDEFLSSISKEDLKSLTESDLIIGKLKGTTPGMPIIKEIIEYHNDLYH